LSAALSAQFAFGGQAEMTTQWALSSIAIGQEERSESDRRTEAEQHLKQARQSMRKGQLEQAESYLQQAEKLNVQYDSLFARFVDTPQKVRRDLNELKSNSPAMPSSRFTPSAGSAAAAPPRDPLAPRTKAAALDAMTNVAKAKATAFLQQGRAALQNRNLPAAVGFWQQAAMANAEFAAGEYSPVQLAAELKAAGVPADRLLVVPQPQAFAGLMPSDVTKDDLLRLPPTANVTRQSLTDGELPSQDGFSGAKQQAARLLARAQAALDRGDLTAAQQLTKQAAAMQVPDRAFAAGETRPWEMTLRIEQAVRQGTSTVVPSNVSQVPGSSRYGAAQGVYRPQEDSTRVQLAQSQQPAAPNSPGFGLYRQGIRALETGDRSAALQLFRQAWQYETELDKETRQILKDKLSLLTSPAPGIVNPQEPSPLEAIDTQQSLLRQKLFREISTVEKEAEQMMRADPKGALGHIQRLRDRIAQSEVDPTARKQLLTIVDRRVAELQAFIDQHRGEIDLDERNRTILAGVEQGRETTLEVQDKIAELVEDFNSLLEEERFAEAEVIAKQVRELKPDSPISRTLMLKSRFIRRTQQQDAIDSDAEDGYVRALQSVDQSRIPFDDREPLLFGDAQRWNDMSKTRGEMLETQRRRLSPVEMQIQNALKTQVEVKFNSRPLSEVLDTLGSLAGINIYADVEGMSVEGVTSNTPVSITLTQPISLKSALHLILNPLRLSYVVQHEVLRITSEQARDSNVYPEVYNVADLVISIPNFVPGYNVGLPSAIREAHRALGYGGVPQPASMSPMTIASSDAMQSASMSSSVLAQTSAYGMLPNTGTRPSRSPSPGAAGGAAMADFDTLIELITSTIAPDSWDAVGGPGAVESFPTNLSLVISQTQDVHDQIADLLEQLRRLQDLQVTIEVRFITLQDNFFERIGVDFDFDIDDNVAQLPGDDAGPSVSIGLDAAGNPTADLDMSFTQGGFGLTAPAFGGFQAANAANIGFAILSDIEAFFLLEAAQGDSRSNVLQAPKVTLFNGQQASVNDTSQRPFVTSLIPVVGDFAAAHQPVIVVLSEGTSLTVQAVVSSDRRFVRLTLQPVFSQIGAVDTFTFTGSTTTNTGSNTVDSEGNLTGQVDNNSITTEGTTVQLPTFSFTTVSTTVSVPDGGTILLGGIKRLREGRNEQGIPMLSKLPYVNRLFKNVGIGREAQSLMLMVTPRIIIQEEEEERLGLE
jgi:general secretion pathway protein D